jgi:sugar O-acyltransferase (sialic acid O-acetyltransferase NeuD family)
MKEKIVIVGAGGFAQEVFQMLDKNKFIPVGFIALNKSIDLPMPVIGDDTIIAELIENGITKSIVVAIGDMKIRERISEKALQNGLMLPPIIHESSIILTENPVEDGVIIYPSVVVMNNCKIGRGALLNSGVTLGHDVEIGDFSNINPGSNLAGRVIVGKKSMIGIGSSIKENVKIGDNVIVGAGSVVLNDIQSQTTVFGVPAKQVGLHSSKETR